MDHGAQEHVMEILWHPALVHFPIAFYGLEALLLALWVLRKQPSYHQFAAFVFKAAYLCMLAAIVAGYVDSGGWSEIAGTVRKHFNLAMLLFVVATLRAVYWIRMPETAPRYKTVLLAGALITNILIMFLGHYGGQLVHG